MDATPVPCGQSAVTARRSNLYGYAGYGYCPSHSRWYRGPKLLLICTCEGTVTGFGLASPKLYGGRQQARQMLKDRPANRPAPGTAVVTGKGLAGEETEAFFAGPGLGLELIRPARKDEMPRPFPNWLRQRVEAIIWTLKNQLGLGRHGGRVAAGLWARVVQRLLVRNAAIWHNWLVSAPVKRSLIAYDHCLLALAPGPRHRRMGRVTEVYLEAGKRRVFACAPRWPGWCRPGRDEEAALAALAAAAPRYAEVCARAGLLFDPVEVTASFEVLERVTGSATTDFGALDVAPALDGEPMAAQEPERLATLIQTAWDLFERTAAVAPPVLRKGPRGGGRDRDQIVAHVRETEVLHARMLGLSERPFPPQDVAAAERVRAGILAEIRAGAAARPPKELARSRRPARFVARRTAWHALDHAWEILDKQEP